MCSSIECGFIENQCSQIIFGPSAGLGVQNIKTLGTETSGTYIRCSGTDSCD